MNGQVYGLWSGASVHEVAQVTAVAFQHSETAGEAGTIAKLFRVVLLAPLILILSVNRPSSGNRATPFPWFVAGFAALVCLGSLVPMPETLLKTANLVTTFLLTAALGAMGLNTRVSALRTKGLRPAVLALVGSVYLALTAYLLVIFFTT